MRLSLTADGNKSINWGKYAEVDVATKESVQTFLERGADSITKAGEAIVALDPSMQDAIGKNSNYFPVSFTEEFTKSARGLLDYFREVNLDKLWINTPVGKRKVDVF